MLNRLKACKNVVKMLEIYYSKGQDGKTAQNLVFEYCNSNLEEVIQQAKKDDKRIPIIEIKKYMK